MKTVTDFSDGPIYNKDIKMTSDNFAFDVVS